MSTAAVSSSIYQEIQVFYQNRTSDLQQLGSALKNGDLAGAEQAFNTLAQLGEGGPFSNADPFANSGKAKIFTDLGQALQAGNLTQAQADFVELTSKQSNSGGTASSSSTPSTIVALSTLPQGSPTGPPVVEPPASNTSIYQQIVAYGKQRQADIAQLGQDLQAGNASAAEQDVTTLTALGQAGPNANGQIFERSDRAQDFQGIGQSLQAGDLATAQADFANLEATFGTHKALGPPDPLAPPVRAIEIEPATSSASSAKSTTAARSSATTVNLQA